ncbi:MAG: tRNA (cytosine(32)/uridine(32)-2'-O)-methyltransferase TrmJ [Gammaproteobacteria bacterium]|nr:tRNA (cytosine(32)/uridine(32)-2'-O)-methyltransferase TrmJ [Gammaproteobacteria bacterium]
MNDPAPSSPPSLDWLPVPLRVVLLRTTHPGNIGAAARAMKTMGLRELVLVSPRAFPHDEATARASGADDVLAAARVCGDLDEALTGCRLVMGASARLRSVAWPQLAPPQAAARLLADGAQGPVALLFGTEKSGLSNEELDRCQVLVNIPANAQYSSLNLSMAVQVLAYELRMAWLAGAHGAPAREVPLARAEDLARFYEHLQRVLTNAGFLDPAQPRQLMRRLRRLFARAEPDEQELNILRGMLSAVDPLGEAAARRRGDG